MNTDETTEANVTTPNALTPSSPTIISNAKNTPVIGALKPAAIPPAAPAATSERTRLSERRDNCPNIDPRVALFADEKMGD
ncbi:MAG: hypothetical protein QY317_16900 [Candidatus Jettenia caeni]|nr:hypothetical protein [Candidatus Jettenia sp. AMX1]WKZ15573.1 MAG: hypothetical protein QY317_16900 [Candidatus Jettenia caeni]